MIRNKQYIIGYLVAILSILYACDNNESTSTDNDTIKPNFITIPVVEIEVDSTNYEYLEILKGLKKDFTQEGWIYAKSYINTKYDYTSFHKDSLDYVSNYNRFFEQDRQFIDWLLSFKNDTTRGGLWQKHHKMIDSYLSECNLPMKKNRAGIILIENFLNGKGLICYECINDPNCNENKYNTIEIFLAENEGLSIEELREKWKKINSH